MEPVPLVLKTWGSARHGVLGHGEGGDEDMPRVLEIAVGVTAIACGELHCIALTDNGTVLTWGSGTLGALGHGITGACRTPAEVIALRGAGTVVRVCAGSHHSLVCTSSGDVFFWGTIGAASTCEPLPRLQEGFDGRVMEIGCGSAFCVALTHAGVAVWGGEFGDTPQVLCAKMGVHSLACGMTKCAQPGLTQRGCWVCCQLCDSQSGCRCRSSSP